MHLTVMQQKKAQKIVPFILKFRILRKIYQSS